MHAVVVLHKLSFNRCIFAHNVIIYRDYDTAFLLTFVCSHNFIKGEILMNVSL